MFDIGLQQMQFMVSPVDYRSSARQKVASQDNVSYAMRNDCEHHNMVVDPPLEQMCSIPVGAPTPYSEFANSSLPLGESTLCAIDA